MPSAPTHSPQHGSPLDLQARLEFALDITRAAGDLTLEHFQRPTLQVDHKRDGSHVTVADRAAEQFLRESIQRRFPADGVLGEEFGETPGSSGLRWILDPIDGTASFVCGVPLYSILVALEQAGRAILGVIHLPALRETTYAARGLGAWHTIDAKPARQARVSNVGELRDAALCTTSLDYFVKAGVPELFPKLQASGSLFRGWSDAYAAVLVATGRAEAVVEPKVYVWDVAALQAVIEEAGGMLSDFTGEANLSAGHCVASNGLVHRALVGLTRQHVPRP